MPQAHVLLLEDDAPLLSVLGELFLDEQIEVTICTSLADIYAGLNQHPHAVVVTDSWAEPRRVELCKKERQELIALAEVASVILTTGRRWAATSQLDALATVRIVQKPYDLDELVRTVRAAVNDRPLRAFELSRTRVNT